MFNRIFGKPEQETSALATLDELNEVRFAICDVFSIILLIYFELMVVV